MAIDKAIQSSLQLRSKKELIEHFIDTVNARTDVDQILPPVSRFSGGGKRAQKKQTVIEKLKAFFEKYFGLLSADDRIGE